MKDDDNFVGQERWRVEESDGVYDSGHNIIAIIYILLEPLILGPYTDET